MEEVKTRIITVGEHADGSAEPQIKLHNTPCLKGQEWCAYTFLLIPKAKISEASDNYGVAKVICFGTTSKEVEKIVQEMLDDGRIEKGLPFIRVSPTGWYRFLKAGGDDRDLKESYDLNTKEAIVDTSNLLAEKRKREMREMKERMDELKGEAKQERKAEPDSYEVYAYHRTQFDMSSQRERQLKAELEFLQGIKLKAQKAFTRIEREHGNFKLKFNKECKTTAARTEEQIAESGDTTGPTFDEKPITKDKEEASEVKEEV